MAGSVFIFLARWLRDPAHIGAIMPSGKQLARAMAAQVAGATGAIVELGGGTGTVTEALLAARVDPKRLIVLERDGHLAGHLAKRFPGVTVVHGDARDVRAAVAKANVGPVGAFVSSLPLLSLPSAECVAIVAECSQLMGADGRFVQFTYGPRSPIPNHGQFGLQARATAWVLWNVPPATVWRYTRAAAAA